LINSKILLFVPVYNCENQIIRVLEKIKNTGLDRLVATILVLDNGSSDLTCQTVQNYISKSESRNVVLARNSRNIGLGGSHKAAFQYAIANGYDYIAVLHGDDQGDPADLVSLIHSGIDYGVDCYLGSRFSGGSTLIGYSKFRTYGNYIFNYLFSLASKHRVYDLGSGLNLYKVKSLNLSEIKLFSNDLTFNCFLLLYSIKIGQNLRFFPISWSETDQVSNVKLYSQALKTLGLVLRYRFFSRKALVDEHAAETFMESSIIFDKDII